MTPSKMGKTKNLIFYSVIPCQLYYHRETVMLNYMYIIHLSRYGAERLCRLQSCNILAITVRQIPLQHLT